METTVTIVTIVTRAECMHPPANRFGRLLVLSGMTRKPPPKIQFASFVPRRKVIAMHETEVKSPAIDHLARLVRRHGGVPVAKKIGVTEGMVRHILAGRKPLSSKLRAKLEAAYPAGKIATPSASATAQAGDAASTRDLCDANIAALKAEQARMASDPDASPRERASIATSLTSAIRLRARLHGETAVTEAAIEKSAPWRRLKAAILDALQKHPQAAEDVLAAVNRLLAQGE